jgi:ABC-type antimicrobial peptide transport system permease subunit
MAILGLLISHVREAIRAADSHVPIIEITTLKMEARNSVWQERMVLLMTAFFGIAGLILASVGLYGALAPFIVRHMRDTGIRMALGAQIQHVRAVCVQRC